MRIKTSIFKAYDIRGIYPTDLDTAIAYLLGRAFATFLIKKFANDPEYKGRKLHIAAGGDMRSSTADLKAYFINGVADLGVNVNDIGRVSTPTLYFATAVSEYDGGVQVTASHNPKEWNGFKLVGPRAAPIGKNSGIDEMQQIMERGTYAPFVPPDQKGAIKGQSNVLQRMITEQRGSISVVGDLKIKPFKIAIDAGNGMGGEDMEELFKTLPCHVTWMNVMPDGNFPAHPADPMVEENTQELRNTIVEKGLDMGIAIDGDADRYFFFDEKGEVVPQEILRGLMAQVELKKNPGASVVYDIRPGRITTDLIEAVGGRATLAPVGHSLIKEQMLAEDAVFGAESSGHYFYKLPYGTFEAPTLLVQRFLEYVSAQNKPVSQIVSPHKKYSNSGEINTRLKSREAGLATLEKIKQNYADGKQHFIDGLSIEYPDYWFSVRLSNTEPLIRLIVEAHEQGVMEQKKDELIRIIREAAQ